MKKILFLIIIASMLFATNSIAQKIEWNNWAYIKTKDDIKIIDGIKFEFRLGSYTDFEGELFTKLQIKVHNTRKKKVMVDFKEITFSNGETENGGDMIYPSQESSTYNFEIKGIADEFKLGRVVVEYYE